MKNRILLVDDDRDIVAGTSMRLRAAGYDTVSAYDGESGYAAAVELCPNAIVLDIRMPKKDGLETLDDLKNDDRTKSIPVVMLSASLGDQTKSLDCGARFFLKKPYHGSDLIQAVHTAVNDPTNDSRPSTI